MIHVKINSKTVGGLLGVIVTTLIFSGAIFISHNPPTVLGFIRVLCTILSIVIIIVSLASIVWIIVDIMNGKLVLFKEKTIVFGKKKSLIEETLIAYGRAAIIDNALEEERLYQKLVQMGYFKDQQYENQGN